LKLAGLAGLAILPLPEMEIEMNYGDILAKLGQGQRLSQDEIEFLRLQGNQMQLTSGVVSNWQAGGIRDVAIDKVNYSISALNALVVRSSNTSMTTGTFYTYTEGFAQSDLLKWSSTDATKIFISPASTNLFIFGSVLFALNAGTYSRLVLNLYNGSDSLLASLRILEMDGVSATRVLPVCHIQPLATSVLGPLTALTYKYFKIAIEHDDGGTVDSGITLGMTLI
jgi:hypothetical protein